MDKPPKNKTANKILHSDKLWWTFARSTVSSQLASWVDLILGFVLFTVTGMSPFWSAAIGAVAGGVFNCIINYRFTFHATGCSWKAVALKYAMVWIGSVLLNSYGTQFIYMILRGWDFILGGDMSEDAVYAISRLVVSLAVSLAWNFVLQRTFVYRTNRFDPWAIRFIDFFSGAQRKTKQDRK